MTRKKAEVVNLAARLHSVVSEIAQHQKANANVKQEEVLFGVLHVEPASENRPVLLERIAQLQAQPDHLRSALVAQGVPEKLLVWYTPVKEALLTLYGSSRENLQAFNTTQVFVDALARLDACEALMETDELSWNVTALNDLLASIDGVQKTVDEARGQVDEAVANWLTDRLRDMRRVVETTLRAGADAGREQMFTLIGRAHCRPCPPSESRQAHDLIKRVTALSERFRPLLHLGVEAIKLITAAGG